MEATVIDLCAAASPGDVVALVTKAVQRRQTRPERLAAELAGRSRHRNRALLRELFGDVGLGAESSLEIAYLRDVERPPGLPASERQRQRPGLAYHSDVGYARYALLVELDGQLGHQAWEQFRDMGRDNQHALLEWLTLRDGWHDVVERPCEVAFEVARVLQRRGWTGDFGRCARCRQVPAFGLG